MDPRTAIIGSAVISSGPLAASAATAGSSLASAAAWALGVGVVERVGAAVAPGPAAGAASAGAVPLASLAGPLLIGCFAADDLVEHLPPCCLCEYPLAPYQDWWLLEACSVARPLFIIYGKLTSTPCQCMPRKASWVEGRRLSDILILRAVTVKESVKELFEGEPDYPRPDRLEWRGRTNWAVVGASGAGKSTLINSIRGLSKPDQAGYAPTDVTECTAAPTPFRFTTSMLKAAREQGHLDPTCAKDLFHQSTCGTCQELGPWPTQRRRMSKAWAWGTLMAWCLFYVTGSRRLTATCFISFKSFKCHSSLWEQSWTKTSGIRPATLQEQR